MMPGARPALEPRRQPVQDRSRRRFDAMVDAASTIIVERGFEALTTEAIAEEAGVAIGSVYQFFPNKHAVANAVALRSFEGLDEVLRELDPDESAGAWTNHVALFIDALARWWAANLAADRVWSAMDATPDMRVAAIAYSDRFHAHHVAWITSSFAHLEPCRVEIIATTCSSIVRGILQDWGWDGAADRHAVDELQFALIAYVAAAMEPGRTRP